MLNGNRMKSERGRSPRDLYITPEGLAITATVQLDLDEYYHRRFLIGLDAGCGTGVWGRAMYNLQFTSIEGIDIKPDIVDNLQFYDEIYQEDFLNFHSVLGYDVVFGNPPYSLAEAFIKHALELVNKNGYVYFLLRLSFLEGINRGNHLFKEYPLKRVYVCSRRPSFFSVNGKHTTDTLAYAMFLWQDGYKGKPELDWLDWEYEK